VRLTLGRSDILLQLQGVFHETFGDDSLVITEMTSAPDIEEWDSLSNVRLMLAVEQSFGIRMKAPEIAALKHVGDLVDLVARKK
jgi:acyl carrier protein